jgi:hypothetical protein
MRLALSVSLWPTRSYLKFEISNMKSGLSLSNGLINKKGCNAVLQPKEVLRFRNGSYKRTFILACAPRAFRNSLLFSPLFALCSL